MKEQQIQELLSRITIKPGMMGAHLWQLHLTGL